MNQVIVRRMIPLFVGFFLLAAACGDDDEPAAPVATPAPTSAPATTAAPVPTPAPPTTPAGPAPFGPVTVVAGIGPFFEYQFLRVAQELGITAELGLVVEFLDFPAPPYAQLAGGDIDISYSCVGCLAPRIPEFADGTHFITTNQFRGFLLVGRRGETGTYDELFAEIGDEEEALDEFVRQNIPGASFAIQDTNRAQILAMVERVGLTLDDVEIIEFANQQTAGLAFIRGEGDYYMGSLPQQARMVFELSDQFIAAAPHEVFTDQPFTSEWATTHSFLDENEETVLRLLAAHYRAVRYLYEQPDVALDIVAEGVASAAGELTGVTTENILLELEFHPTLEEAGPAFYLDESSPLYYGTVAEVNVRNQFEAGILDELFDWQLMSRQREWHEKLLARADLIAFIRAPLP